MTIPRGSRVTVYPNNSVTVDGAPVAWTAKDFQRHGIDTVRVLDVTPRQLGRAEHRTVEGVRYTIFPTRERVISNRRWEAYRVGIRYLRCTNCHREQPETAFRRGMGAGRRSQCKGCLSTTRQEAA